MATCPKSEKSFPRIRLQIPVEQRPFRRRGHHNKSIHWRLIAAFSTHKF